MFKHEYLYETSWPVFFFFNLFFFSIQTDNFVYYTNNLLICIVRRWDQSVKDGSNLPCMPRQDNENNNPTFCRFQKNTWL